MSNEVWKIAIDTGGTFTDCLASDPNKQNHRLKILSSGVLKGSVISCIDTHAIKIHPYWAFSSNIFIGYTLCIPELDFECEIVDCKSSKDLLILSDPCSAEFTGKVFELSANEEAPVLACRLLTNTPLKKDFPPIDLRLGSTKGTNALLENKGARCALITSKGFKDLLLIGTQQRPDLFALQIEKRVPIYDEVFEIGGRIDANGTETESLAGSEINKILDELEDSQYESVAVCLVNSYKNLAHEEQIGNMLAARGFKFISLSGLIAQEIKLLPRTETTLVNAYLQPIIIKYLSSIHITLNGAELKVMKSGGGLAGYDQFHPKDSLLSGPAGGVIGAGEIAKESEHYKVLTLDMGGTSTDVARYDNGVDYQFECEVGQARIMSPSVAIHTVAAGGGSICSFDGTTLKVGPDSAGAFPGPACYGNNGPLTITDVNLLLGRLDPSSFRIPVDVAAAQSTFTKTIDKDKIDNRAGYFRILEGFRMIANEKMARAIQKISTANGYDPRDYSLLSFGGAGGQHACAVAEILGINDIIVPYDAGLLSAYGISRAKVEKFNTLQILRPWNEIKNDVSQYIETLTRKIENEICDDGYDKGDLYVNYIGLFMRFFGQDNVLEIQFNDEIDVIESYRNSYESLYGHWIEGRTIELVSVKVSLAVKETFHIKKSASYVKRIEQPHGLSKAIFQGHESDINTYIWEDLKMGAEIQSPAIVTSQNSTFILDPGWKAFVDEFQNIRASWSFKEPEGDFQQADAAKLELFTNRFMAIADEMGELLKRTAFSVNIKERLDFSCGILDSKGELIVNAPHIPVHLGSLGVCVRMVLEKIQVEEDDVIITNHPGYGGSHLPDITLIAPVFYNGRRIAFVANRAHHAEIGGKRPGSMPPDAKNLEEEGVAFIPQYIVKKGKANWDSIEELLKTSKYPSRSIDENLADLRAGVASLKKGQDMLHIMCEQHNTGVVLQQMEAIKSYAHIRSLELISSLQKKQFTAIERLDDGSQLSVKINVSDKKIIFDFNGTSGVHAGNLNANISIVTSAVLYVLRVMIGEKIPLNEGLIKAVELRVPECLLNPTFVDDPALCPAVVGGNTEVSQRLVDTLIKAFELSACSQGTMNNLLFGNDAFGYYETIGGGTGAGNGFHGCDAVHHHMTNTLITDPEILEHRYPAILEEFSIRKNSGGMGQWNGGNGIRRIIKFTQTLDLTVLSQHRVESPFGLSGGQNGQCGSQHIITRDGDKIDLDGIDEYTVMKGDRLVIETPGGGGYGIQGTSNTSSFNQ